MVVVTQLPLVTVALEVELAYLLLLLHVTVMTKGTAVSLCVCVRRWKDVKKAKRAAGSGLDDVTVVFIMSLNYCLLKQAN